MSRGIRNKRWNYGGPNWKLSRSKIGLYQECPRCFYLDNKLGIRRPSIPGFLLNSAVDELLKKEFDYYRERQEPHPLFKRFGIEVIPYQHPLLNTWRENFEGVIHTSSHGFEVSGAIDDLWVNPDGQIIVVDYKSTAKAELDMSSKWVKRYFNQLEVYQWLLKQQGLNIADVAYILYANGDLEAENFSARLEFDMTLHEHKGRIDWVPKVIEEIAEVLERGSVPNPGDECEYCEYYNLKSNVLKTADNNTQEDGVLSKSLFD